MTVKYLITTVHSVPVYSDNGDETAHTQYEALLHIHTSICSPHHCSTCWRLILLPPPWTPTTLYNSPAIISTYPARLGSPEKTHTGPDIDRGSEPLTWLLHAESSSRERRSSGGGRVSCPSLSPSSIG